MRQAVHQAPPLAWPSSNSNSFLGRGGSSGESMSCLEVKVKDPPTFYSLVIVIIIVLVNQVG